MTPDMPILDGAVAGTAREYARALREQADAVEQVAAIRRGLTAAFVARDPSLYFFMLPYYDAQRRYTDTRERVRRAEEHFTVACNELVYGSADVVRGGDGPATAPKDLWDTNTIEPESPAAGYGGPEDFGGTDFPDIDTEPERPRR